MVIKMDSDDDTTDEGKRKKPVKNHLAEIFASGLKILRTLDKKGKGEDIEKIMQMMQRLQQTMKNDLQEVNSEQRSYLSELKELKK